MRFRLLRRSVGVTCVVVLGAVGVAVADPSVGPLQALRGGHAAAVSPLAPLLSDPGLGTEVSASVIDASSGKTLLSRSPDSLVIPASPLKLLTATAALQLLGPSHRLVTRVETSAHLSSAGLLSGDLDLVGGGDPTLSVNGGSDYPTPASLDVLAEDVRRAGVRTVAGRVILDSSLFSGPTLGPGWRESYVSEGSVTPVSALELNEGRPVGDELGAARSQDSTLDAGAAFVVALQRAGVKVSRPYLAGVTPHGARLIASVSSAPLRELVERMLSESDNDLAECLGRLVALAQHKPATFAGEAAAVTSTLSGLGVALPRGAALYDASGLSRDDHVTMAYLTTLFRFLLSPAHSQLRAILTGLPVAGASGTLQHRYGGAAADGGGYVRAKTGSLSGISSLVGLVVTRGGRLLVFAVTAQAVVSRPQAEAALDRFAAALAALG